VFAKPLAEARAQGPEALPCHGWDRVEAHLSLAEAGVLPRPGRPKPAVQAECLAGLAEQRQQRVRQHRQPAEGVSAVVALPDRVPQPPPPRLSGVGFLGSHIVKDS
jgi:hypothetical protein